MQRTTAIFIALVLLPGARARLQSTTLPIQPTDEYPLQGIGGAWEADAQSYTLSIVESVRTIGYVDRTPATERNLIYVNRFWIEEVRVIDSLTLKRGAVMRIVVHARHQRVKFVFKPGHRYLVLTTGQRDGRFRLPESDEKSGLVGPLVGAPDEAMGWAAFETHVRRLASAESAAWRITESVADTLIGSTDEGLRRAATWFDRAGYPELGDQPNAFGRRHLPFGDHLASLVQGQSAYRRAKIYQVLCHWKILGYPTTYMDALIEASQDPNAWTAPGDLFQSDETNWTYIFDSTGRSQRALKLTPEQWTDMVLACRSVPIRNYFLLMHSMSTSPDDQKRLAVFLDDPNSQLEIVRYFALVNKLPQMGVVNGTFEQRFAWINRAQAISFWRERFGMVKP